MANRLGSERSPYLLQHAENPVDWYPWGDEALAQAKSTGKPILVSIGYSACHWCHVMAHESFEDPDVAAIMNEHFVNIKVDREERPDVDAIYMEAVQALTGQGGWPLNVFLLPDGRPFFGGTYFPPTPRHGMPSWSDVLSGVSRAISEQHEDVLHNADVLSGYLARAQRPGQDTLPSAQIFPGVYRAIAAQVDWQHGGFGAAPKFPQPLGLELLLRLGHQLGEPTAIEAVILTLDRMAAGGIFDQLGGGFHRYSVDSHWLAPHFEKMLYDNALLARVYLQAHQLTGEARFATIARRTLEYTLRDLAAPEGGFYAAQDADSEGEEGRFYLWTLAEFEDTLGHHEAALAAEHFGVTETGNFEGRTILTKAHTAEEVAGQHNLEPAAVSSTLEQARESLLQARSTRIPPATDDKLLAGWNGLIIRALAEGGRILAEPRYTAAAERAVHFILDSMRPNRRLVRSYRNGPSSTPAFLEDYGFVIEALITLYETTGTAAHLRHAEELAREMINTFWDEEHSILCDTPANSGLIVRPRSLFDNPIPSGNSAASSALLRLVALTGADDLLPQALSPFHLGAQSLERAPLAFSYLLTALDFYLSGAVQIAVAGEADQVDAWLNSIYQHYLPNKVVATGAGEYPALLHGRQAQNGQPVAFVCRGFSCDLPAHSIEQLTSQLAAAHGGE